MYILYIIDLSIEMANKMLTITSIYISFCLFSGVTVAAETELKAVVVIYRHGDRTPIHPYTNDPYRNVSYWPVGFGQLTNLGKMQHKELGEWLRRRYHTFLSSIYSEKDIYIYSTDVDRTLMSAEANLAGLYPPTQKQVWDNTIQWQPIPVHTRPEKEDALLAGKKYCAKYDMLMKKLMQSDYFRNVDHQLHDLYAYLSRYSGDNVQNVITLEYLYNTLYIETLYNFTLPNWTKNVFPDKLRPWAFLSFAVQANTPAMQRLKTGPLINHIIEHFKNHTTQSADTPKLTVFSGHDSTIANILMTFGAFDYHSPPYASTILLEMWKQGNRSYINMFYKNTTEAKQITLKGCQVNCDFTDFISILKPVTITLDEWELECKLKNSHVVLEDTFIYVLSSAFLSCLLLIVSIIVCMKKSKKDREQNYVQLPNEEYT